jgi:DNA-directed RNA polymerase I subunit RPA2
MSKANKSPSPAVAKEGDYSALRELFRPHVESFDYFLDKGLDEMIESIRPMVIRDPNSNSTLKNILHASNSGFFFCVQLCCSSVQISCAV